MQQRVLELLEQGTPGGTLSWTSRGALKSAAAKHLRDYAPDDYGSDRDSPRPLRHGGHLDRAAILIYGEVMCSLLVEKPMT